VRSTLKDGVKQLRITMMKELHVQNVV